jgi:hypothetical protein
VQPNQLTIDPDNIEATPTADLITFLSERQRIGHLLDSALAGRIRQTLLDRGVDSDLGEHLTELGQIAREIGATHIVIARNSPGWQLNITGEIAGNRLVMMIGFPLSDGGPDGIEVR